MGMSNRFVTAIAGFLDSPGRLLSFNYMALICMSLPKGCNQ